MITAACVVLSLALFPALLYRANARRYRPPVRGAASDSSAIPQISVLIPARNEELSIADAVEAALASKDVEVEVVVLDDHSEDRTAERVRDLAARDARVRLLAAPPLPEGWCGKQHACSVLAQAARHERLAFVDADVRLRPDGLVRLTVFQDESAAALVSGVPAQETGTWLERLVIPLIHFLLLGYLPMGRMRRSKHPGYAAGCGQLFLTRRVDYEKAGGHAAIRTSRHDGLTLPRAYRRANLSTDLCDTTDVATCRMYRGAGELWQGLAKNATEGMGHPSMILLWTVLLLGGQGLPLLFLLAAPWWFDVSTTNMIAIVLFVFALACGYAMRLDAMRRFRQSRVGALLHPVGVTLLVAIQWYGLARVLLRRPATWKGRR